MRHFIAERQFSVYHIQMAGIGVQVHGIEQIAANKVDAVKILTEFDQILAGFAFRAFFIQLSIPIIGRRRKIAK